MPSQKNVKVPSAFLNHVEMLLDELSDVPLSNYAVGICNALRAEIDARERAFIERTVFTAYKTAPKGTAERERLRQKYLNMTGIADDFRTSTENN
jgi:hypothetical protein